MALEITKPKFILDTKRGWGMLITGVAAMVPFLSYYVEAWTGVKLDAAMVAMLGEAGVMVIDAAATVVGVGLWVWGSFRPTAPLVVNPANATK